MRKVLHTVLALLGWSLFLSAASAQTLVFNGIRSTSIFLEMGQGATVALASGDTGIAGGSAGAINAGGSTCL